MSRSTRLKQSVAKFRAAQDRRYQQQLYTTTATVTAVTKDSSGRVVSATGTIDSSAGQPIQVGYGASIGVGSVLQVTNVGPRVRPIWSAGGLGQGAPAGAVGYIVGPGDQPIITPAGLNLGEANLLRNSDFSQTHRGHVNQPIGWTTDSTAVILAPVGEE
jgi:hypothetical protein